MFYSSSFLPRTAVRDRRAKLFRNHLTLILAAILLEICVAAISSKCLLEEVETATSRPEGPFSDAEVKMGGAGKRYFCSTVYVYIFEEDFSYFLILII